MAISYYIIDTETTGLRQGFHDLVEISIIRYSDRLQLSQKIKALKPENASYDALQITGKTMKDLYEGINHNDAIEEAHQFLSMDELTNAHRCIVCHNAPFDRKFLHEAWSKNKRIFPGDLWLDTLTLSRRVAKLQGITEVNGEKPKFNLYAACDLFGIKKTGSAHNAADDTRNTYFLLKYFIDNKIDFLNMIKRIPHGED